MADRYLIQEYFNLIYDNYDTSMLSFPTSVGILFSLFGKLKEISLEKNQTTLLLFPNKIFMDQSYSDFCQMMVSKGEPISATKINNFYRFSNGSVIFFKIFNQVEHSIFKYSDNVVFYNVSMIRNNVITLELIDKIKNYNKKIFINCIFRDNVAKVLLRKIEGSYCQKNIGYDMILIGQEIRRFKLKKIQSKWKKVQECLDIDNGH